MGGVECALPSAARSAQLHARECVREGRRGSSLRPAKKAFARAVRLDDGYLKAKRALSRVESREQTSGTPWWQRVLAATVVIALLGFVQYSFYFTDAKKIDSKSYAALTLGLLALMAAALYLDKIATLRVAGVTVEKTPTEASVTTSISLLPEHFTLSRPLLPDVPDLLITGLRREAPEVPALQLLLGKERNPAETGAAETRARR